MFLPKDIDLDSTEMDETEREVEYFKRYVSMQMTSSPFRYCGIGQCGHDTMVLVVVVCRIPLT